MRLHGRRLHGSEVSSLGNWVGGVMLTEAGNGKRYRFGGSSQRKMIMDLEEIENKGRFRNDTD